MTDKLKLLCQLLQTALRLVEDDFDNADRHRRIASALTIYGKRKFGPRFGDHFHKPRSETLAGDK